MLSLGHIEAHVAFGILHQDYGSLSFYFILIYLLYCCSNAQIKSSWILWQNTATYVVRNKFFGGLGQCSIAVTCVSDSHALQFHHKSSAVLYEEKQNVGDNHNWNDSHIQKYWPITYNSYS